MKYGLVFFSDTDNVGDDIQSYAAMRFLPSVDYVIDREHLDAFSLKDQKDGPVSVIMNGWYLHNKCNWPPSNMINPLPISMHFTKWDRYRIGSSFLERLGGEYLRHYEPIGARDDSTMEILQDLGIEAYFSGCMTLTLEMPYSGDKTDEIILVDVEEKISERIKAQKPDAHWIEISHTVIPEEYRKLSMNERFSKVEALLKRYQQASCVVTERLHCALPCLALGTPVLLIYHPERLDRMGSFLGLLHTATPEELLEGKTEFDVFHPPVNSELYMNIRKQLEEKCKQFIYNCEQGNYPSPPQYSNEEIRKWKRWLIWRPLQICGRFVSDTRIGRIMLKVLSKVKKQKIVL